MVNAIRLSSDVEVTNCCVKKLTLVVVCNAFVETRLEKKSVGVIWPLPPCPITETALYQHSSCFRWTLAYLLMVIRERYLYRLA